MTLDQPAVVRPAVCLDGSGGAKRRRQVSCLAGAGAVMAAAWGLAAWGLAPWGWSTSFAHGTLAGHMLQHLVVMNAAAPLLALALRPPLGKALAVATVLQILLLWGWHVPPAYEAAQSDVVAMLAMQASLLAVAVAFWGAVLAHPVASSWQTIFALLVTAKAVCLFGALLCFSRRVLYLVPLHGGSHATVEPSWSAFDDQQLAGLLMMASCALIYVTAALTVFLRWFDHLGRASADDGASWRRVDG